MQPHEQPPRRCRKCRMVLVTEEELDYGLCEGHIEAAIERSTEQRDWDYYHPGEPFEGGDD